MVGDEGGGVSCELKGTGIHSVHFPSSFTRETTFVTSCLLSCA